MLNFLDVCYFPFLPNNFRLQSNYFYRLDFTRRLKKIPSSNKFEKSDRKLIIYNLLIKNRASQRRFCDADFRWG